MDQSDLLDATNTSMTTTWLKTHNADLISVKRKPVRAIDPNMYNMALTTPVNQTLNTSNVLVIEIPEDEIKWLHVVDIMLAKGSQHPYELMQRMVKDLYTEQNLRKRHPGVRDAWDKYQMMVALAKNESDIPK